LLFANNGLYNDGSIVNIPNGVGLLNNQRFGETDKYGSAAAYLKTTKHTVEFEVSADMKDNDIIEFVISTAADSQDFL